MNRLTCLKINDNNKDHQECLEIDSSVDSNKFSYVLYNKYRCLFDRKVKLDQEMTRCLLLDQSPKQKEKCLLQIEEKNDVGFKTDSEFQILNIKKVPEI